jgi:hypothetical protein
LTSEPDDRNDAPGAMPGASFYVEFDADEVCPVQFTGDPVILLFFISWAYSLRFGGMHELAQATLHMQRYHKVELRPLLTFADHEVEDEDDRFALEHAWQEAAPVAASARAVADALDSDDEDLHSFTREYEPALQERLRDLAAMCDWGAAHGSRVRLTFKLDYGEG